MTIDLSGYKLTFDDEFNSLNLWNGSSGTWKTSYYFGGRTLSSNGEKEYYSDPSTGINPFSILPDGTLEITAAPSPNTSLTGGLPYSSGLITTEPTFSQTYGYFEMRAKLPAGHGMWPAFWLLPTDKSWPPEIDIMEVVNLWAGKVDANTHTNASGGYNGAYYTNQDLTAGYHTYGLSWTPTTITWYFDGQAMVSGSTPADMHKPMYILANLAVGGNWPGNPDSSTPFPAHMDIDYIRAYSNDPNAVAVGSTSSPSPAPVPAPTPAPTPAATGPDTIKLHVAGDQWQGDPQFALVVDGKQVGTYDVTASHAAGQWQDITVNGSFAGAHEIDVRFLNDAWGGSASQDRNLYIDSIALNGQQINGDQGANGADNHSVAPQGHEAVMEINGTLAFFPGAATPSPAPAPAPAPAPTPVPSTAADGITLHVSADQWQGNPQFVVLVDGKQVGGTYAASASHAAGQWQDISVAGNFAGAHEVDVTFVNDGWGGSASQDRNLYVASLDVNGQHYVGTAAQNGADNHAGPMDANAAVMDVNGTLAFTLAATTAASGSSTATPTPAPTPAPAPAPTPAPAAATDVVSLHVSEDAYQGDAQFVVLADGKQVGGTYTVAASHAAGQWQDVSIDTHLQGVHEIDVKFVNDAWGGKAGQDRNLYLDSITVNGHQMTGDQGANGADNHYIPAQGHEAVMDINGLVAFHDDGYWHVAH